RRPNNLGVGCPALQANTRVVLLTGGDMNSQNLVMLRFCLIVFVALLIVSPPAFAQATTSIRGLVSDPEGAPIQGANITLQNMGTTALRTTTTDDTGSYEFPQVHPGTYRIRAEMPGFKSIARENVELPVNTPVRLNLNFAETGSSIEVNVFATPPTAINTVDATIGNTIRNS